MISVRWWWVLGTVWLTVLGCAGAPAGPASSKMAWHQAGSGAFIENESQRMFNGVGRATGLKSRLLLRIAADNDARKALKTFLDHFADMLAEEYRQEEIDATSTLEGRTVSMADELAAAATATMDKAVIQSHWSDPQSGALYALCQVPLAAFTAAFAERPAPDSTMRAFIRDHAAALHSRMLTPMAVQAVAK